MATPDLKPVRVTYSSMSLYRRCPEAWAFKYLDRLDTPTTGPKPELDFGSWFHGARALHLIERGRAAGTLLSTPEEITTSNGGPAFAPDTPVEDYFAASDVWWKSLRPDVQEAWSTSLNGPLPDLLRHAYTGWVNRWGRASEAESPVAVEHRFERTLPLRRPREDGREVLLFGFIDELYIDERRGITVVRDCKTTKDVSLVSSMEDLMDSQVQLYAWGIAPECKEWGIPSPRAVAFDRVRSMGPKQPQLTKAGKLSKAVTDYDLATYLAFAAGEDGEGVPYPGLKKDGSGAGVYTAEEEVVAALSDPRAADKWFRRTLTPVNRNILRTHLISAIDTVEDTDRAIDRKHRTGDAPRNMSRQTCRWCDFADYCRARLIGGPTGDYPPEDYGLIKKPARPGR